MVNFIVKPFYFLTVLPKTLLALSFYANIGTNAVLLSSLPLSYVLATVRPAEGALPFSFVVYELTLILLFILPD